MKDYRLIICVQKGSLLIKKIFHMLFQVEVNFIAFQIGNSFF